MTGHLASLGAIEISRERYLQLLGPSTRIPDADFGALDSSGSANVSGARIAATLSKNA